ncbi:hypothetical protein EQK42_19115 [Streptomyces albidoflavus]|uniref:hypothetical protein n=1 Tax=Streptomyces albidoflavus TaxID=1886 RepID=UPI000FF60613|nr:hypothetical protein [Streptomyces albidoflavus]RWZ74416.1 hypothetical protein EQK42_19115 [Streptomyces albidoflavus]
MFDERREPGDCCFEALEADRRGRQAERDAAEDPHTRDLDTVLRSGGVLSGRLTLNSDRVPHVLPPRGVLMAPMVLRRSPRS